MTGYDGYDAHVDQCMFGIRLPEPQGEIQPVKKPTNLRVTSATLAQQLTRTCDGNHNHTHLEGQVPGCGATSRPIHKSWQHIW